MPGDGKGVHVEWSWVAITAVMLLVGLITSTWNSEIKQHQDDRNQIKAQGEAITEIRTDVGSMKSTVETNSRKNDARWGALLDALPAVERKMRENEDRQLPVFEPEWHPR